MLQSDVITFNDHLFRLLLESIGDGVFMLDLERRIILWNPAMERITGYQVTEVMGRSCRFLQFDQCFGRHCTGDLTQCQLYRSERVTTAECFLRHKEGHRVPVIKNARMVREKDGRIIGIVEVLTDLTALKRAHHQVAEAAERLGERFGFDRIVGRSQTLQPVFAAIRAAADSDASILIQGESGTGKELVAGAIHYHSKRRHGPLVVVNGAALSEPLLESELFGHARGAFTGAIDERTGRFEEADGGTVFLDEIGEISPLIQVKLLRVLQEHEIERVGESKKRRIDIRIIAATHRELSRLVQDGRIREDLYYRLKVFPIFLPPLRARREDIPLLVDHFRQLLNHKTGKRIASVSRSVMQLLMDHTWPGNVRELENAMAHAFVLCSTDCIEPADLPVEIRHPTTADLPNRGYPSAPSSRSVRTALTRETLVDLLTECSWNKAETARRLGVSRAAIWKYMKQWAIPQQMSDPPSKQLPKRPKQRTH
jgi:two-component system, NtrC family, response regulator HydG